MATTKTTIDGLAGAVADILKEYDEDVKKKSKKVVRKVARNCKKAISAAAPKGPKGYAGSWKIKYTKNTDESTEATLYSSMPGLPHLLEHGHVINIHGTVVGVGGARPHIGTAEAAANKELEEGIRKIV